MQRTAILETLLNTLEAERYVRGPLLATIVDELAATERFESAAAAARVILEGLENGQLVPSEFVARVASLRRLVQVLAGAQQTEPAEVLMSDSLSRAVPRSASLEATPSAA